MLEKILLFIQTNLYFIFVIALLLFLLLMQTVHFQKKLKTIRKDTLKRSKAVREGQTMEQLAPFFEDFPCNPSDAKFLGKPVDYVAFSGLDEEDEVSEILFIEVKTGESKLSPREKSIKKAIHEGRVRYVEYRMNQ